ncbi:hypothetical protein KPZU09_27160 [Klebsiella pneumoniae]|uniref:Uncharacterized protein n=1 Tax=Klebsiella pneumoniae TaxID=573 RepID=A0A919HSE8_KLEPN|nr:hypothetical protein KPZU09_27160 [Klebsiella pneumoniae]
MIGGASIAPMENPTPAQPAAIGRSDFGNHSPMVLALAGVAAASAPPIKKRNIARCSQLPAPAWAIQASAHRVAQIIKPSFRPMTSISQPHSGWKIV